MSRLRLSNNPLRRSFGKIKDIVALPNLIEIQSKSFNDFAQLDCLPKERRMMGLEKIFRDIFPIHYNDLMSLEFVSYELGHWACTCGKLTGLTARYTWICSSCKKSDVSRLDSHGVCTFCTKPSARYIACNNCHARVTIDLPMTLEECRSSGATFSMPLKVKLQLITWQSDEEQGKILRDIKEQEIFFADVPVMADIYEEDGRLMLGNLGTFLINGVDRVIVSQLHRSPGVVFTQSKKVKDTRGKSHYIARIIPMRGSWLDFEFDSNDILYVRVDKKKKILVTTFLQALGVARENIIPYFYRHDTIQLKRGVFSMPLDEGAIGIRLEQEMIDADAPKEAIGKRLTATTIEKLRKKGVKELVLSQRHILHRVFASDVINPETQEVLFSQGTIITDEVLNRLRDISELKLDLIASTGYALSPTIALTLSLDKTVTQEQALRDVHMKIWPGDSASAKEIKERLESTFFNSRLYDLTRVGRIRLNRKLGISIDEEITWLTIDDILGTINYLVRLREQGEGELDDIDHLGNRRVRLVGELLNNQAYLGLLRIERIVRERFRVQEPHGALMPQDFLNVKPLSAMLREFFGTGQLSQFMDQTNPLAEIAHKRRLSALGPGGVMKDRATFEIRDVHTSHYGRICPIETPEGQTIGLISSLATYAHVNDLGFIEAVYRPVKDTVISDEVIFLDAFDESRAYIAQTDAVDSKTSRLRGDYVLARHDGNFVYVKAQKVTYVDLSPKQLVSVSTALIPFLEHDDATRALMGSNMQRQAVPLVRAHPPTVGTGMEQAIVQSSGAVIVAKRSGVVDYVSATKIVVRADQDQFSTVEHWLAQGVDIYHLAKFQRSSYSTWQHQTPIVSVGDHVKAGDILSNGSAISDGELSLGSNLLVAFMPWHGYNFEDAVVLNKRLVADDTLTSVHIDEFTAEARDTKLGPEEITRDIPNVSEAALEGLDEDGIVKIGTRVKPADILVGKVTLKGDIQYSPEEKLLRAIFGEKSREVRDTSLRVPPGVEGTVIDVKIFSRKGVRKDKRYRQIVEQQTAELAANVDLRHDSLEAMVRERMSAVLVGASAKAKAHQKFCDGGVYSRKKLEGATVRELLELRTTDSERTKQIQTIVAAYENQVRLMQVLTEERMGKMKKGDTLPSGVIKVVKVYIAMKRPISMGDKLAGRHGNKGVVSILVPREDMPFMRDGTPVDIVLNPVGVPSRMNVGQILETILGYIGLQFGKQLYVCLAENDYAGCVKLLKKFYGGPAIDGYEKQYGKKGILQLAAHVAETGVRYKTPVFDGADFDTEIQPLLKDLSLDLNGTFRLCDGRTGEYFDQPVTVGSIYMMKLNHMVDDKLHARSVGPYSLVTQQPLGGKAQLGGQRFGEMEVWALKAHGAAYSLQEMLTYKSDDVMGRNKVYEALVRDEDVPEPGLPESFNVLIKELQSLALRIDLFKSSKEEIGE